MKIAIIVHGGAWDYGLSEGQIEASKAGCRQAVLEGWKILRDGGSALDAVEKAICVLEDDPVFDAGRGSFLNAKGRIQLDAAIMNGGDLNTGGVAAVERVRHPIALARRVLESEWAYIVGEGALEFARQHGLEERSPWWLATREEMERWSRRPGEVLSYLRDGDYYRDLLPSPADTVGAVALDAEGNIVAGTSTGGAPSKPVGRVGDSSLIGCGLYADNMRGGVSSTGPGELIIRVVLAKHMVDALSEEVGAQQAAEAALQYMKKRVGGVAGLIAVDRWGRIGRAHTTNLMSSAYMTEDLSEPVVEV